MKNLHTVLGATGASGKAVIAELQRRNLPIQAVSRSKQIPNIKTINADLLNEASAQKVINGSSHVYLCIGLPYDSIIWQRDWPIIMQNVIKACIEANARLIYLDNIYMYSSPLPIPFDEETPQNPTTKKGKARKVASDLLVDAMNKNKIKAVIGRSADFYGKGTNLSVLYIAQLQRMLAGKNPQWLGKPNKKHTYANVADNAKALISLALDESIYGQVWHLPVGKPITPKALTTIFNEALGTNLKISFMPPFLQKVLSVFIKPLKEVNEMQYQFDNDYIMSFDKFQNHFTDFKVTDYKKGIREMIEDMKEGI